MTAELKSAITQNFSSNFLFYQMIKYGSAQHGDCPMVHLQEEVLKRNFCTPQRGLRHGKAQQSV